ncbi:MAG: pilus assembly PilX N-terminal domain-containing protein, partial [Elusimicrobia bacterium]|nr:pilus assembly PilX N-terminal domain-containing protein [Elusimicrobiota bacterium]
MKNDKGAILVVTIVSMMVLTIIGYVVMQMFSMQNVLDTYDQTKIRVDLAAEGIVERARGYLTYIVKEKEDRNYKHDHLVSVGKFIGDNHGSNHKNGYLYEKLNGQSGAKKQKKWYLLKDDELKLPENVAFDGRMYPPVFASVYCQFVEDTQSGISGSPGAGDGVQLYKLVGVASATVNVAGGTLITSVA